MNGTNLGAFDTRTSWGQRVDISMIDTLLFGMNDGNMTEASRDCLRERHRRFWETSRCTMTDPLRYRQRIAAWFKDIHDTEADTDSAKSGFFTWDAAPRESRLAM